tara:strand:- start:383 stop:1006 length:624 start_codon:yes stop_codon:yes gene_type:complete
MKNLKLDVRTRERKGTAHSKKLRNEGEIPAVVYSKAGSSTYAIGAKAFAALYKEAMGTASIVEITDEASNKKLTFIKEIQKDPLSLQFIHVDFQEVSEDALFTATVPVEVVGESYGVKNEGASIEVLIHELEIKCKPNDLPSKVTVDITDMKAGDTVSVSGLTGFEGVSFTMDETQPVVMCLAPGSEEEEDEVEVVATEEVAEEPAS